MLAEKIKACRREISLNQVDLAEKLKVSVDTVRRWESGKIIPDAENLGLLSDLFNKSSDYLLGRTLEAKRDNLSVFANQVVVPIYRNISIHCGEGTDNETVEGELEQYLPLPAEYVGTKEASLLYGLYVDGNSMEAARIADGNIAIIRKCDDWFTPGYGDPCYVQYQRDGFEVDAIKFYYPKRDGSSVTLRSAEGSGVRELTFDREDIKHNNPNILGVVVGVVEFHKPMKGR